ncbi:MAG: DUF3427 domain-containing protein [Anaerovoracaceae bacterium]|jgi:superfamily II DNA or RNA helicase
MSDSNHKNGLKLVPGLYEQVLNDRTADALSAVDDNRKSIGDIDEAEASGVLTRYLDEIIHGKLDSVAEERDINAQLDLTNQIIDLLQADDNGDRVKDHKQLLALLPEKDPLLAAGKSAADIPRPETSLAGPSLFTGSRNEPQLYSEIKKEIGSSTEIEMLVSFIKFSGLRLIMKELEEFTDNGGGLRVITTSYMGATDMKAVEELSRLKNTEVRISYNTKSTRLHAKAYVFCRDTGFTTAYVGSSNLSGAAMTEGLEWNMKVTEKSQPEILKKIRATFESYWNSDEFEEYHRDSEEDRERLTAALMVEKKHDNTAASRVFFDIMPYPFQRRILDRLRAEREVRGRYKNLIVAATGTGKTMVAAFDYRNYVKENPDAPGRLLFVAHREEILKQSLYSFQEVMKDPNFGEMLVGSHAPSRMDHLFASVQSVNSKELWDMLPEDYYDYIVVDEFHHAAAKTYRKLLEYFRPKILLGLTATPERMDGKSILDYFGGRIAAEIRLPEAIDRGLLCPFQYFGVTDTVDLDRLQWSRGGYEKSELENVYALDRKVAENRAERIVESVRHYVTDMDDVRGLGFCVSVKHAQFMAEFFNSSNVPSLELDGDSSKEERDSAKSRLQSGEIRFIFVVDLYNEGVDIPEVNTILFLRPTESLTVFLQQLGRGLRLAEGKECLTVLDFIGRANRKYDFERKFFALMSNTENSLEHEIRRGFGALPAGCYIQLEKNAQEYILENIRKALHSRDGLRARAASFEEDTGRKLSLEEFCRYYQLDLREFYSKCGSFARLCADAGVGADFSEPAEEKLSSAFPRLAAIDSRQWIGFLDGMLDELEGEEDLSFPERMKGNDGRMMEMFYITVWQKYAKDWSDPEVLGNLRELAESPVMINEIRALLQYRMDDIDVVDRHEDLGFECPLDLYCTYTRDQLFAAMDYENPGNVREGVKWLEEKKADVLLVTLNKSEKAFSPTTMYDDYSINDSMFHWQSQNRTAEDSPTGQRYIHHRERGSKVLLFVREFKNDAGGAAPYTFLGPADYLQHEGSAPMNIIWHLKNRIPAKFLKKTNKLASV